MQNNKSANNSSNSIQVDKNQAIAARALTISEAINLVRTLLERPIAYHVVFAKIAGSITGGLLLSQLYYWQPRCNDPDGWIYKTEAEWQSETHLSRKEQATARKQLIKAGVLEVDRKGVPARLYYRLNSDALYAKVLEISASSSPPKGKNPQTPETFTQSQLSENAHKSEMAETPVVVQLSENAQLDERKGTTSCAERDNKLCETAQLKGIQTHTQQGVDTPFRDYYSETTSQTTIHCAQPDGSPLSHPIKSVCVIDKKEKEGTSKEAIAGHSSIAVNQNKDHATSAQSSCVDQSSAAAVPCSEKSNNRETWECPEPKLRREFMRWLVGNVEFIHSSRYASNWCDRHQDKAVLAWDDFTDVRNRRTAQSASFATWGEQRHEMMLRQYNSAITYARDGASVFLDNFLKSSGEWLQWVKENHNDWLQEN